MTNSVIEYLDLTKTSNEPLLEHGLPLGMLGRQLMNIPSGETTFLVRVENRGGQEPRRTEGEPRGSNLVIYSYQFFKVPLSKRSVG